MKIMAFKSHHLAMPVPKPYNNGRQLQDKKPNSVMNTVTPRPSITKILN